MNNVPVKNLKKFSVWEFAQAMTHWSKTVEGIRFWEATVTQMVFYERRHFMSITQNDQPKQTSFFVLALS